MKSSRRLYARHTGMIGPLFAAGALLAPGVMAAWTPAYLHPAKNAAGGGVFLVQHWLFTIGLSIGLASGALALYHRPWFRRLLHLMLLCILLELFYRFAYGGPISYGLLLSVPETSGRETLELLAGHIILTWSLSAVALLAILALVVSWSADIKLSARRCMQGGMVAVSMIIASVAIGALRFGELRSTKLIVLSEIKGTFPFDLAAAFGAVAVDWIDTHLQASARAAFRFPNAHMVAAASRAAAPEIYVIVVGETSRRSDWSLFGYPRVTTPRLDAIRGDLILFDHATSNATNTILSLPLALTRAAPATRAIARSQKSVIALLRQAGFETFWVSNQERSLVRSNPISEIASDAEHVSYTADMKPSARDGGLDSNLPARLDGILARLPKNAKAVIFLHMEGSHFGYKDRYPASFDHFPEGHGAPRILPVRESRLVDEYDNSVYFTDYNVRRIIDRLAACACRSGLIYFSDHGERLFDDGLTDSDFGHGFPTVSRQEIEIPLLFWLSDAYQEANPSAVSRLKANTHSAAELNNLFETIVDLAGVDYAHRDASLSLFSDQFRPPDKLEVLNMQQGILSLPVQ